MAQYIERAQANYALVYNTHLEGSELEEAVNAICAIPAADVVPVRHGRWIDTYGDSWTCSVCGAESYFNEDWRGKDGKSYLMNYCHYCGAKMDGGGE